MRTAKLLILLAIVFTLTSSVLIAADCCADGVKAPVNGAACPVKSGTACDMKAADGTCDMQAGAACETTPEKNCAPDGCPLNTPGLNLNVQQTNKIKALCAEHKNQMTVMKQKLALEKVRLTSILNAPKPDKKAAVAQSKKVSEIEAKMRQSSVLTFIAMKSMLTQTQSTKMSARPVVDNRP